MSDRKRRDLLSKVPFPAAAPVVGRSVLLPHQPATPAQADDVWRKFAKAKGSVVGLWVKAGGMESRLRDVICGTQNTIRGLSQPLLDLFAQRFSDASLGDMMDVLNAPYFVGDIDAAMASQVLADKAEGTFLVRFSSEIGSYALSAIHGGEAGHWRLSRSSQRGAAHGALTLDDATFNNLKHMVRVHREKPLHHSSSRRGVLLTFPLPSLDSVRCKACDQYVPLETADDHRGSCTVDVNAPQTPYGDLSEVWKMSGGGPQGSADSGSGTSSRSGRRKDERKSKKMGFPFSSNGGGDRSPQPGKRSGSTGGGADNNNGAAYASQSVGVPVNCLAYVNRANPRKLNFHCPPMIDALQKELLKQLDFRQDPDAVQFLYHDPEFSEWAEFPTLWDDLPKPLKVKIVTQGSGTVRRTRGGAKSAAMLAAEEAGGGQLDISELVFSSEELGKGAFGVVLAGTFRNFDVAIKSSSSTDDKAADEFQKECEVLMMLPKHENLVAFFGWAQRADGQQFIILERVWGGSLNNFIKERTFSNEQLLSIMADIASGMDALHSHDIIHRDLAMRNVLMTQDVRAKLTDFGLARKLNDGEFATKEETMLPIKSMAPEALKTGNFSKANDAWAYGVVVWTMFSGHDPYAFLARQQVAIAVRDKQLELSALPPTTPPVARDIVAECQKYEAKERPSFSSIVQKLEQALSEM